jgi:hypothetical protein
MAITGQQRIGTYIHRDGRKVDMRTGVMGRKRVYFYVRKLHPVFVEKEELRNNWRHKFGNHIFGTGASFQQDWLGWNGEHQDTSWDAWRKQQEEINK